LLQPGSDPIEATFELNDTLYAKAHIPPTDEVYLWLGVNVSWDRGLEGFADGGLGQRYAVISY
jgi:hypothetical protein